MEEELKPKIKNSVRQHLKNTNLSSLSQDDHITVEFVVEGYLNYVYQVQSSDRGQGCVAKIFFSHSKYSNPHAPKESTRCQREYEACRFLRTILPNNTPVPYYCDTDNSIVGLEDFVEYRPWGGFLLKSCDLHIGAKIADMMVMLHGSTHQDNMSEGQFEQLKQKFRPHRKQVAFMCDNFFKIPLRSDHRDNKVSDESVRVKMDEIIQDDVVTKATSMAEEWMSVESGNCCIHCELNVLSLKLSNDGKDIKMTDMEYFRIGPPAFDVAMMVGHYVLLYHYHEELNHEEASSDQPDHTQLMADILELISLTVSRYMEGMSKILKDKFDKHQVWRQILLLLGLQIIAWISGPANLDVLYNLPKAQLNCLNTALRILHKQSLSLDTNGLSRLIHNQH